MHALNSNKAMLSPKGLKSLNGEMKKKFSNALTLRTDAVGYAYTINSEFAGVDIYNNKALFVDIGISILVAVINEAISKKELADSKFYSAEDVYAALNGVG